MRNTRSFAFLSVFLLPFVFLSCGGNTAGDHVIQSYAKAKTVYAESRFSEAADILADLKSFPPALMLRAKALYFSGRGTEAEKTLRRLLSKYPAIQEARLYLGRVLREKGDKEGAARVIGDLLADDAENIQGLRFAAELAFSEGKDAEGAAYLDRAVEAGGELSFAFLERARFRWTGGDASGALGDLYSARIILPEKNPLRRSIETLEKTIREALP